MNMRQSRLVFSLLATVFLSSTTLATEFSYHFEAGETWNYRVQNTVKIPTQGTVTSDVDYAFSAPQADPIQLEVDISGTSNRYTIQGSHASLDLSSEGQASNLQSDMLNDPIDGGLVKNSPNFFFPLPAGNVSPGETWEVLATFHFPKLEIRGAFTSLRTVTTYTYQGSKELADGRTVEVLKLKSVQAPGVKQKVTFSGEALFDSQAGRMISVNISGIVKVKVGFIRVKVPVKLELTETTDDLS
jgi:hypothetical protein